MKGNGLGLSFDGVELLIMLSKIRRGERPSPLLQAALKGCVSGVVLLLRCPAQFSLTLTWLRLAPQSQMTYMYINMFNVTVTTCVFII